MTRSKTKLLQSSCATLSVARDRAKLLRVLRKMGRKRGHGEVRQDAKGNCEPYKGEAQKKGKYSVQLQKKNILRMTSNYSKHHASFVMEENCVEGRVQK